MSSDFWRTIEQVVQQRLAEQPDDSARATDLTTQAGQLLHDLLRGHLRRGPLASRRARRALTAATSTLEASLSPLIAKQAPAAGSDLRIVVDSASLAGQPTDQISTLTFTIKTIGGSH